MRDVKGYEGLYAIDEDGQIYSYISKKYLKPTDNGKGYMIIGLVKNGKRKNHYIHRLVCEAYLDNPNNLLEVNHKDKNPKNNKLDNLEWCDRSYNVSYSQSKTILCEELDKTFKSGAAAGRELGLDASSILKCCKGKLKTTGGYHFRYKEVV